MVTNNKTASVIPKVTTLIKPKYNELCYDSSCGTGGFFHYLNKYVHTNSSTKNHEKFKINMYGNDKTPDLIKPLYINNL
jgi:type I restriction-modification system DNA methylase subunit